MTHPTSASVFESAMQLSDSERAEIAAQLLDSLASPPIRTPEEIREVLAQRLADLDSGRTVPVSSAEAWRMIEADE